MFIVMVFFLEYERLFLHGRVINLVNIYFILLEFLFITFASLKIDINYL